VVLISIAENETQLKHLFKGRLIKKI